MVRSNLKFNNKKLAPVIKGGFSQVEAKRQMAIKRVNKTLAILLFIALGITGVNYYLAISREMILNNLNRETVVINDEIFDLQYQLDKMKSYTNVGNKVESTQLLKKAEDVMEIPYVEPVMPQKQKIQKGMAFGWSLGY